MGFAGVLIAGFALQSLSIRNIETGDRATAAKPIELRLVLPAELPGWRARDELLGPNEFLQDAVAKNLNYDDYVYRVFESGGRHFGVYVAYWSPGRMPVNKVASHTPDRCWTENGWQCVQARSQSNLSLASGLALRAGQVREFLSPQGDREYVIYWHLVGNRLYDYGERLNARPSAVKWWRDTVRYALSGSEAQYFIRLTSNRPFAELAGDPGWEELVCALAKLGLAMEPQ
ncbi:MAG: exosortase-associated EpsI family protein [Opitutaceae bacterium]|nr:exosortase-associated EpsI family protein [Opitutaceae bacterium]